MLHRTGARRKHLDGGSIIIQPEATAAGTAPTPYCGAQFSLHKSHELISYNAAKHWLPVLVTVECLAKSCGIYRNTVPPSTASSTARTDLSFCRWGLALLVANQKACRRHTMRRCTAMLYTCWLLPMRSETHAWTSGQVLFTASRPAFPRRLISWSGLTTSGVVESQGFSCSILANPASTLPWSMSALTCQKVDTALYGSGAVCKEVETGQHAIQSALR